MGCDLTKGTLMATSFEKLQALLSELFQLDQADLDFGIYRIMNQKRDEITRFLNKELLPQVRTAFAQYHPADKKLLEEKLEEARQAARTAGFEPEQSPKVKEIQEQLAAFSVDTEALENEVYSHLYSFFRRYYDAGDFISMRRYKEGVYAIPYEGEEVKLHWANADQYYIKTAEYFRDYTFKLPSGKLAHFKIAEADVEKDNVKAAEEKDRRFILVSENAVQMENGEMVIRFEYRVDVEKRKQDAINSQTIVDVLAAPVTAEWVADLNGLAPSESNPRRTVLEKHLSDYTARNTFDYFIHKNLRGFLRRELDFYIKNEVMRLDDIENENASRVEQYLSKVKALRSIAHKIIEFLAQIEDFQKKLWLKKKFVVETNYCITLDRVPEELYPEIAANDAQREEWVRLFAINEIQGDMLHPGYSNPITVDFLKINKNLPLDTRFFDEGFAAKLISTFDDLDNENNGLLINAENFQALNYISNKYKNRIKCIYIDPPYNTDNDGFLYKDNYRRSSWLSLIQSRLTLAFELLSDDGVLYISIDDKEYERLKELCVQTFGRENILNTFSVKTSDPSGHKTVNPSPYSCVEYVLMVCKDRTQYRYETYYVPSEYDPGYNQYIDNVKDDFTKWKIQPLREFVAKHLGFVDTRDAAKKLTKPGFDAAVAEFALEHNERVFQSTAISKDAGREIVELRDKSSRQDGVVFCYERNKDKIFIRNGRQIYFYSNKVKNSFEQEEVGPVKPLTNLWADIPWNGIANEGGVTLKNGKKPEKLLFRLISLLRLKPGDIVLDFFAGSGTTSAVSAKLGLKWISIEGNSDIAIIAKTRLLGVAFGDTSGVSSLAQNRPSIFTQIKLESYEDTLNNLLLKQNQEQQMALGQSANFGEEYVLRYMLDIESRDTLISIDKFAHPFNYMLNVSSGSIGESTPKNINLVETFNYLLGLHVKTIQSLRGYKVVTGVTPAGERALIIWRDLTEKSNADLEEFFRKQDYNPRDMEFDLIYVNGDNNLENLRRPDETWKVRLIEDEFMRLMFDTEGL
jgi:adenine-specific DNA-methyltransferase